jgi:hypothetical protein
MASFKRGSIPRTPPVVIERIIADALIVRVDPATQDSFFHAAMVAVRV